MPAGGGTFLFRQESTQRMRHKGRYEPIAPPYVSPAASLMVQRDKNVFLPQSWGFQRGKRRKSFSLYLYSRSPFGRLRGPGHIRECPGGALHTFSPRRKYGQPQAYKAYHQRQSYFHRSAHNKKPCVKNTRLSFVISFLHPYYPRHIESSG